MSEPNDPRVGKATLISWLASLPDEELRQVIQSALLIKYGLDTEALARLDGYWYRLVLEAQHEGSLVEAGKVIARVAGREAPEKGEG
jgi:hypothetical protein